MLLAIKFVKILQLYDVPSLAQALYYQVDCMQKLPVTSQLKVIINENHNLLYQRNLKGDQDMLTNFLRFLNTADEV